MKKLIYCAAVFATALFAGSCQRELLDPAQDGSTVTFSVGIPELAGTKANANGIGNGADINNLVYAVYKTTSDETEAFANVKPEDLVYCINPLDPKGDEDGVYTYFNENGEAHVSLELVKNQKYVVLFWAQHEQTWVSGKEFNLTDITYPDHSEKNPRVANSNYYEAFCGAAYIDEVTASCSKRATLTRPFAQINLATNNPEDYEVNIATSSVKVWGAADNFNVATMKATGTTDVEYVAAEKPAEGEFKGYEHYVAMNYIFANEKGNNTQTVKVECTINSDFYANGIVTEIENVPVAQNYKTNILGNLLTSKVDYTVELVKDWNTPDYEVKVVSVSSAQELAEAFEALEENVEGESTNIKLDGDINLNDLFSASTFSTKAANEDPSLTIPAGKSLVLDLNGMTLSATSKQTGKNYNMFNVRGTLTVKNGTIKYQHVGENMGWGASTNIFDVTAGGVLNLEGVTAKNLGGSDMGFVAHLNNWGKVTLNAENCTLESNYVPVRVFNSGPDMNNVTIKNSTLEGGSAAFWVHNYTDEDFTGNAQGYTHESQKALLNLNIYNQGNTFIPDVNGIRYGFTNSIRTDARGVTKKVSEDGAEVTLGAFLENVTVRRGVAGAEENETIKKVVVEEGVAVLYDRTFRRFYALEEVVLPSTLTTIGAAGSGVFQSCNNLKTIVIPESVKVLGKGSFQECSSLESINIPTGVTRIEENCLRNTGLVSVEFHKGVTYFGAQAFRDCKQLTEVVINAPEFTMENNTFGIMAAPFTPMTIHVANAEMKAYVESNLTAHAKTYITVVAPEVVDNTADLQVALAEGKKVVLANDLTITNDEGITAPYGNKTALSQKGGVFDGNGKTITSNILGDSYIYMTNGGTTKNVNITGAFRGIMVMSPTQTVYLDNVVSGGKGVVYAFNTGEGDSTQDLVATNCTFNGWSSWSLLKSATFTNCTFGQGSEYSNVYGRLLRPYINTVFDGCDFCSKCYIDLSALVAEQMVTIKNCSVNGVKITAENWASLVAPEDTCGEGQISVELKNGTFLTAENVADYIVFE